MYTWNVRVFIDVQVDELYGLVRNIVLLKSDVHVKRATQAFPSVTGCVLVRWHVPVQDLVHGLLTANLDNIVILGEHVDDSELAGLNCQTTNAERSISPPRCLEA